MPLNLNSRFVDDIFVLECDGQIVLGEESRAFLTRFEAAAREFCHVVLAVDRLARIDSSGVGLLVRCMSRLRRRGGDLRLAAPRPFLQDLLRLTRLTTVLKSYPTEAEAAGSFIAEARLAESDLSLRRVIVIDRSPDFGVFVRAVLSQRGFEVRVASLVNEVRLLLRCQKADYILLGPGMWSAPARTSLEKWAPRAVVLELPAEFRNYDARQAAETLLETMKIGPQAD
ncbi:MAG TPA: STAS domain-containing protein [Acidobacteriaceae bacterium]|nr:STAS domain-containing protein [Acidobacteriaceae bacterium]